MVDLSIQVFVNILHMGVGLISQSDVDMAQACNACIMRFNRRSLPNPISLSAKQANIKV
jgi:translation initiation factor IF-2